MQKHYRILAFNICMWFLPFQASAQMNEVSFAELIKQLPSTVGSGTGKYTRIKVCGYFKEGSFPDLSFFAMYRAPGNFAFCLADARDGTPIVYVNGRELIMYDPVEGLLMCLSDARFDYTFNFSENHFRYKIIVSKSKQTSNIDIGLRSLFDGIAVRDVIPRVDAEKLRLTGTTNGGTTLAVLLDHSQRCPVREVTLTRIGAKEEGFVISKLAVDEDAGESWPISQLKGRFAGAVPIKDLSKDALSKNLAVLSFMEKAVYGRFAIQNRNTREEYSKRYGPQVGWDKIEQDDQRVSRQIREILGGENGFCSFLGPRRGHP